MATSWNLSRLRKNWRRAHAAGSAAIRQIAALHPLDLSGHHSSTSDAATARRARIAAGTGSPVPDHLRRICLALENAKDFLDMAGRARQGRGPDSKCLLNKCRCGRSPISTIWKNIWACGRPAFSATTPKPCTKHGRKAGCWASNSVLGRQLTALAKSIMTHEPPPESRSAEANRIRSKKTRSAPRGHCAEGLGRFFSFMQSSRA